MKEVWQAEDVAAERARIVAGVVEEHRAIREHFRAAPDEHIWLPLAAVLRIIEGGSE